MTVSEEELKAGAKAPRVTLEALEGNIVNKVVYNAADAAGVSRDDPMGLLTFCVLTLRNGYTVVGISACAAKENYNEEIGGRLAEEDAKKKIWPLMGYALREELYALEHGGKGDTWLDRLKNEQYELHLKMDKLVAYITGSEHYKKLDETNQELLMNQYGKMSDYNSVLIARIQLAEAAKD